MDILNITDIIDSSFKFCSENLDENDPFNVTFTSRLEEITGDSFPSENFLMLEDFVCDFGVDCQRWAFDKGFRFGLIMLFLSTCDNCKELLQAMIHTEKGSGYGKTD